jgi:hypothetical protein
MIVLFRTLGLLLVAIGLLWMVIAELFLHESRGAQVRLLLLGGVLLLAVSVALSVMGRVSAKVGEKRCRRCGKPVLHGGLYCSDHLKEAVNEFRDHQRQKGDGG